MLKWIETTGRTEDEAIAKALEQLGMDRDEVSVEIIDRAKSGFLGLGGNPAKIRMTYETPDEAPQAPAPVPEQPAAPVAQPAPQQSAAAEEIPPAAQSADSVEVSADDPKAVQIEAFLTGLLAQMEVAAKPVITLGEENCYQIELVGENLGCVIGRRGETLDAIQQLTSYTVNRGAAKRVRIHLDAEHYRDKREESLRHLAVKMASKVVKYRRNMMLEPMNAYERHIIHTALQEYPNVSTYSTGTEPNRRTVVAYSPGEKN